MVNWEVGNLKPLPGVSWIDIDVSVLLVEKPVTDSVNPAVLTVTEALMSVGAAVGTVNCREDSDAGVRFTPPAWVVKDGVIVMVLATVPL